MKQLAFMAALILTGFAAKAQTGETRKSEEFKALEVKNGIEVIVTQSNEASLRVESDTPNNMNNIVTEYKRGILKIYMREADNQPAAIHGKAKVFVSAKNPDTFKAVTGSSITINGRLTVNELNVKLETGSSFSGEVESTEKFSVKADSGSMFRGIVKANAFAARITGGASVKISGYADVASISCNNGSMLAGKFICQNAEVRTFNASTAFVNTIQSINANADASSSITYYGEPASVNLGENTYAVKRDNLKLALNN